MPKWTQQRFEPNFAPLYFLDTDELATPNSKLTCSSKPKSTLSSVLNSKQEISFCLRRKEGEETRGGYYFNVRKSKSNKSYFSSLIRVRDVGNDAAEVKSFRQDWVRCDSLDDVCVFVNHVSGRKFSAGCFKIMEKIVKHPAGSEF